MNAKQQYARVDETFEERQQFLQARSWPGEEAGSNPPALTTEHPYFAWDCMVTILRGCIQSTTSVLEACGRPPAASFSRALDSMD